jgi:hypothetical protein
MDAEVLRVLGVVVGRIDSYVLSVENALKHYLGLLMLCSPHELCWAVVVVGVGMWMVRVWFEAAQHDDEGER